MTVEFAYDDMLGRSDLIRIVQSFTASPGYGAGH
jgi:hypothetical protein